MKSPHQLSVVIPIGASEEDILHLNRWLKRGDPQWQWIVSGVQGGGNQKKIETDLDSRFTKVFAQSGRAHQLNVGAKAATGDFIWFLHCDSDWDESVVESIHKCLAKHEDCIYFFRLQFKGKRPPWMFLNEWGVRVRSEYLRIPFGDQGFLMPQKLFWSLGGYDEEADYGEDHLLIWQAHKVGVPVRPTFKSLRTSARKYQDQGWSQVTKKHLKLTWQQAKPELQKFLATKFSKLPF